jgi:hypothetical protein
MKTTITLLTVLSAITLTGCYDSLAGSSKIDQSNVCIFNTDETAKKCKDGQLSFFQPDRFGNEQLPLIAAATYCDFNHPVMHNNGGVVCVFTAQRMK